MDKRDSMDAMGQYHPVEQQRAMDRIMVNIAKVEPLKWGCIVRRPKLRMVSVDSPTASHWLSTTGIWMRYAATDGGARDIGNFSNEEKAVCTLKNCTTPPPDYITPEEKECDDLVDKFLGQDPFDGGCPADIETVVPKLPEPDICIYFGPKGVRWTMKNATGVAPDLDLAMRDIQRTIVGPA